MSNNIEMGSENPQEVTSGVGGKEKKISPLERVSDSKFWSDGIKNLNEALGVAAVLEDLTRYAEENPNSELAGKVKKLFEEWQENIKTANPDFLTRTDISISEFLFKSFPSLLKNYRPNDTYENYRKAKDYVGLEGTYFVYQARNLHAELKKDSETKGQQ